MTDHYRNACSRIFVDPAGVANEAGGLLAFKRDIMQHLPSSDPLHRRHRLRPGRAGPPMTLHEYRRRHAALDFSSAQVRDGGAREV